MTTDERNAIIAKALAAAGLGEYAWADTLCCPQGHTMPTHGESAGDRIDLDEGDLCGLCIVGNNVPGRLLEAKQYADDPTYHPEWRFRRAPKDFSDATTLLAALEAYCEKTGLGYTVGRYVDRKNEATHFAGVGYHAYHEWHKEGSNVVSCLQTAFLAALTTKGEEA